MFEKWRRSFVLNLKTTTPLNRCENDGKKNIDEKKEEASNVVEKGVLCMREENVK